jgi:hypothetical protein
MEQAMEARTCTGRVWTGRAVGKAFFGSVHVLAQLGVKPAVYMINHLTGGPPDTQSLTLGVGLGRFHVTLRIHSVAVLWLSGTRELPRTLPKTHDA